MTEPPDLAQLAKRYVALWQDYLSAAAADPELIDGLARLLASMGAASSFWAGPAASAARAAGLWENDGDAAPPFAGSEGGATPPRAATVAAAPDERGDGMADLARRLAALEERLAALEAAARPSARRARATARRRRP